jgi:hypothetical protein
MYQTIAAIPSPGTIRIAAMRTRTAFAEIKAIFINALIMPKLDLESRACKGPLSKICDEAAKAEAGSAMDPLWDRPRAPRLPLRTSSTVQGGEKQCGTYAYLRLDGLRFSARRLGLELRSLSMRP